MSLVLVEVAEGIGTVTLNRPHKLNAFDRHTCRELIEALQALVADAGVRVEQRYKAELDAMYREPIP